MDYKTLCLLLQEYERGHGGNCGHPVPLPTSFNGAQRVRPSLISGRCCTGRHGNVQYAALDNFTSGCGDLPIVVAVGVNYTQKQEELPDACTQKCLSGPPWVEDRIPSLVRARLAVFVKAAEARPELWRANGLLDNDTSSQHIREHGGYHLILTNLCPWITTCGWGDLNAREKGDLIGNPPGGQTRSGVHPRLPQHIADLSLALSGADVLLWVGHTLSDKKRFRELFKALQLPVPWLIAANLASHWPWRFAGGASD